MRDIYKQREAVHKVQIRNKLFIQAAKDKPCTDCGLKYPYYIMQFDHIVNKSFCLSKASAKTNSLKKIQEEIDKCEVVCANCHAERTFQRMFPDHEP